VVYEGLCGHQSFSGSSFEIAMQQLAALPPLLPHLLTSTLTLLFTDIEGSTHLLQQMGDPYALVLSECWHLL